MFYYDQNKCATKDRLRMWCRFGPKELSALMKHASLFILSSLSYRIHTDKSTDTQTQTHTHTHTHKHNITITCSLITNREYANGNVQATQKRTKEWTSESRIQLLHWSWDWKFDRVLSSQQTNPFILNSC